MKKVALIGSTGYVGAVFRERLERRGVEVASISGRQLLGMDVAGVRKAIADTEAQVVINCAGYTGKPNVDACETDKANCLEGNAVLPGKLREACEDLKLVWGHVSSGCIFAGERPGGGGWREDDAPNFSFRRPPCSFYSGTKALGEEVLGWGEAPREDWPAWKHEGEPSGFVWRLRIPFNEVDGPRNYLSKMQRYDTILQSRNSLSHLQDFAEACWACVANEVPRGIYNVTNPGSMLTSEVVKMINDLGVNDKRYKFFDSEEDFMARAAKTPRSNCVLDTSKLQRAGIQMRPVQEAIEWSLRHWQAQVAV